MEPSDLMGKLSEFQAHYLWIAIVGGIAAFLMAYGIGANDVANAFATPVGSKVMTFRQAVFMGAVCETLGAWLLGASVADTVRKDIIDGDFFQSNPEVLMLAMVCALLASGLWLIICSYAALPVSGTHSIIGALLGIGLSISPAAVQWSGLGSVVISWIVSPLLSAAISALMFCLVRGLILRRKNGAAYVNRFYPVLLLILFHCLVMSFLFKIPMDEISDYRKDHPGETAGIGIGSSFGLALITYLATYRGMHRQMEENPSTMSEVKDESDVEKAHSAADLSVVTTASGHLNGDKTPITGGSQKKDGWFNTDIHDDVAEDDEVSKLHEDAEKFPEEIEGKFKFMLIIIAAFASVTHGSNDVANAIAPMISVWSIFKSGVINTQDDVPWQISLAGGLCISLGLLTYGSKVLSTMGVKLMTITPSRGFSIGFASSCVIFFGSFLGIPLSTTHCQVGATVGVGLCESKSWKDLRGVNVGVFGKVLIGWVITLVFTSVLSMVLFTTVSVFYFPRIQSYSCGPLAGAGSTSGILYLDEMYSNPLTLKEKLDKEFKLWDTDKDGLLTAEDLIKKECQGDGDVDCVEEYRKLWEDGMNMQQWGTYRCLDVKTTDLPCRPLCANREEGLKSVRYSCIWTKEAPSTLKAKWMPAGIQEQNANACAAPKTS